MKRPQLKIWLVLAALLAGGTATFAQSNGGVPGPDDYAAFSRFITDRNIFDPDRQPHISSPGIRTVRPTRITVTPGIQFVGTMSYDKGTFAFFNANSVTLSKVAQVGDQVAGYTVADIDLTLNAVRLESSDKKEQLMKIGDGLRQENGKWIFARAGELSTAPTRGNTSTRGSTSYRGNTSRGRGSYNGSNNGSYNSDSTTTTPTAPPSTAESNDVLKRLMQLREQENQ